MMEEIRSLDNFQSQHSFTDQAPTLKVTPCSFGLTFIATQTELSSCGSSVLLLTGRRTWKSLPNRLCESQQVTVLSFLVRGRAR